MLPCTAKLSELKYKPVGIILGGGPYSVYDKDAPHTDPAFFDLGVPILGICYGMHILAHQLGGHVQLTDARREYGPATLEVCADALENPALARIFSGIRATQAQTDALDPTSDVLRMPVLMSHGDSVDRLPEGFEVLASSEWRRCSSGDREP